MNADLTFDSVVYKKLYDTASDSKRQSIARGINTPDVLTIQGQDYVDSSNKVAGKRRQAKIVRVDTDPNNLSINTSFSVVAAIPGTATQAQVDSALAHFKAAVADSTFLANVLNGEL
jgi:hypothetical protein